MTLQKKIARKKIWLEIVLVWFGPYICPDKPKPIYMETVGWAKEQDSLERFSFPQL